MVHRWSVLERGGFWFNRGDNHGDVVRDKRKQKLIQTLCWCFSLLGCETGRLKPDPGSLSLLVSLLVIHQDPHRVELPGGRQTWVCVYWELERQAAETVPDVTWRRSSQFSSSVWSLTKVTFPDVNLKPP